MKGQPHPNPESPKYRLKEPGKAGTPLALLDHDARAPRSPALSRMNGERSRAQTRVSEDDLGP